jgi:hypothetical protein
MEEEKTEEEKRQEDYDKSNYWIVRIPIVEEETDDAVLIPGLFEIEEAKLKQMMLEERVEKSLGKSKVGPIYQIGKRYIGMCESVVDLTPKKYEHSKLKGSLMDKITKK